MTSSYYDSLPNEAKERYVAKLESVGLSLSDDPYLSQNDSRFSSEMSLWPSIEYGHIFTYYISRPGTYTQEQLISWKQLEAYSYIITSKVGMSEQSAHLHLGVVEEGVWSWKLL